MEDEYDLDKMKRRPNPYKDKVQASNKPHYSPEVLDYFKQMSLETGVPFDELINLYLKECARKKIKLNLEDIA